MNVHTCLHLCASAWTCVCMSVEAQGWHPGLLSTLGERQDLHCTWRSQIRLSQPSASSHCCVCQSTASFMTCICILSSCAQFLALHKIPPRVISHARPRPQSHSFSLPFPLQQFKKSASLLVLLPKCSHSPQHLFLYCCHLSHDLTQQGCSLLPLLASCNLFSIQDSEGSFWNTGHSSHLFESFQQFLAS